MELSKYDVIKRPVVTSKSAELYQKFGKITFEVLLSANKIDIRRAVESIWGVKVADVRTSRTPGKKKIFARREFTTLGIKKAIVKLKPGYKIDLPGLFEGIMPSEAPVTESEGK